MPAYYRMKILVGIPFRKKLEVGAEHASVSREGVIFCFMNKVPENPVPN
jgi:hypothetical protein